ARASASLILRLEQISAQAAASGFADEVRLLTDHDLDPIGLHNAELLHSARAASPIIDLVAEQVVTTMHGRMPLGQLSEQVGCGPQGYRALLRLLRKGVLGLSEHARITLSSTVHKEVMPQ